MQTYIYAYVYVGVYIYIYIYIYACVFVSVCAYIYIYIYSPMVLKFVNSALNVLMRKEVKLPPRYIKRKKINESNENIEGFQFRRLMTA